MTRVSLHLVLLVSAVAIAAISGSTALIPLYREAFRSSEGAALNFADEVAAKVAVNIDYYVAQPLNFASAVSQATRLGAMTRSSNESIAQWLCDLVARSNEDILFIYYFDDASGFIAGRENTLNLTALPPIPGYTVLAYYSAANQLADFWYFADGRVKFDGTPPNVTQHTTFNHTIRPYTAAFRGATVPSLSSGDDLLQWASPFVDFSQQFADFGLGGPIMNTSTRTIIGIFGVFYRTIAMKDYLTTLRVAQSGRAFLVDAGTGVLLGSNAGDPAVTVGANGTVVLASPSQMTGAVAQRAVQSMGKRLTSCTSRCAFTFGEGLDALYVTIIAVSDKFGLDLRVVVAVPASDFLSSIQDSLVVGVGAAAGVISGVLVVSAFLLHCLLRPLRMLEQRLYESSTLQYKDFPVNEEPSCLSEIATIETAYSQLVAELKKVRSFLPQSVLRQLDVEQAGDFDAEEAHRGGEMQRFSPLENSSRDLDGRDAVDTPSMEASRHLRSVALSSPQQSNSLDVPAVHASASIDDGGGGDNNTTLVNAQKGGGGAGAPRKPPLYLGGLLQSRRVTIVAANLCSFHKALQCVGAVELQALHTTVTKHILRTVNANQGVLEWLHGDRFTASYNASLPCSAPAERCCQTITSLLDALPRLDLRGFTGIRFGAATDVAFCGNLGCDAMRRFSVVGSVVNHTYALAQQTKLEAVQSLVCAATFQDAQRTFLMQYVNYVLLPQSPSGALIATVVGPRIPKAHEVGVSPVSESGAQHEFSVLFAADRATTEATPYPPKDIISTVNEAFEFFAQGELNKVKALYNTIPKKHSAGLARLLRAVEHVQRQAGPQQQ